jgi:hypothetical protein
MKHRVMLMRPDGDAAAGTATAGATDAAAASAADAAVAASTAATDAAAATAAQATADAAATAAAAKTVPAKYDLKLPDKSTLDATVLERTAAIARELGLSDSAAAQKVLDLVHQEATTRETAARAAVLADHQPGGTAWSSMLDNWKAETLADATLGKTPEERTAAIQRGVGVIDKFAKANPEMGAAFKQFLNTSGLGEKREVVHFFKYLGEVAGERPAVMPSGGGSGQSAVERQYQEKSGMNP